ncbi:hypothetical protein ASD11_07500 [Aeromicrobium sp. Root495]|uniref:sensor histidine kinase n=1 Tax=Aeromicrobium sp. Root495 TaxID=1736550 RepID=UPI0006FD98EE|nr:histidine kinase [Aeromicrobium sp. Root495]KQY59404.1 hypothetical protein ASD11_07500 [Aeromicrobium sp. Root495]
MPALPSVLLAVQARFDEKSQRKGLAYPWWGGFVSKTAQVGIALAAVGQRDALTPPSVLVLAVALVALPHVVQASTERWVPWWATSLSVGSGVAWIMAVDYDGRVDLAPAVLAVLVAEVVATDGLRRGTVVAAVSVTATLALDVLAGSSQAGEIVLGLFMGAMLRWQMRALLAERAARRGERERAALAERQRIAREIHDLVAHSMSVTLLQVTGARRALLDDDTAEASAALADAERVGREAMSDIRRTVGLLADGAAPTHALPTAADIPTLLATVRAAGLTIRSTVSGDLDTVPVGVGLGVYRVVQEALTNVVKHAPGASATFMISATSSDVTVLVTNPNPRPAADDGLGHGITGMRERTEQMEGSLEAHQVDDDWVVALSVPLGASREPAWRRRLMCGLHGSRS